MQLLYTLIICNSIYLFIPGGNASGLLPQDVDQQISNGTFNRGTGLFLNTCAIICFLCQFIFDSLSRLSENKLQIQSKIHLNFVKINSIYNFPYFVVHDYQQWRVMCRVVMIKLITKAKLFLPPLRTLRSWFMHSLLRD